MCFVDLSLDPGRGSARLAESFVPPRAGAYPTDQILMPEDYCLPLRLFSYCSRVATLRYTGALTARERRVKVGVYSSRGVNRGIIARELNHRPPSTRDPGGASDRSLETPGLE